MRHKLVVFIALLVVSSIAVSQIFSAQTLSIRRYLASIMFQYQGHTVTNPTVEIPTITPVPPTNIPEPTFTPLPDHFLSIDNFKDGDHVITSNVQGPCGILIYGRYNAPSPD